MVVVVLVVVVGSSVVVVLVVLVVVVVGSSTEEGGTKVPGTLPALLELNPERVDRDPALSSNKEV